MTCSLIVSDILAQNTYEYQMKSLHHKTSNFELELGIIMNPFCAKFEEPMFRKSRVIVLMEKLQGRQTHRNV